MLSTETSKPLGLREKMVADGAEQLTDAELLAIFINVGPGNKTCLHLAEELLQELGDLRSIMKADFTSFQRVKGLGFVRYLQLQALSEIHRRCDFISLKKNSHLKNSEEAHRFIKRQLRDKQQETFAVLFMDGQHGVIRYEEMFQGSIDSAKVYLRPLMARGLKCSGCYCCP